MLEVWFRYHPRCLRVLQDVMKHQVNLRSHRTVHPFPCGGTWQGVSTYANSAVDWDTASIVDQMRVYQIHCRSDERRRCGLLQRRLGSNGNGRKAAKCSVPRAGDGMRPFGMIAGDTVSPHEMPPTTMIPSAIQEFPPLGTPEGRGYVE